MTKRYIATRILNIATEDGAITRKGDEVPADEPTLERLIERGAVTEEES